MDKQIEPRYYGYQGGYASLTKCEDCEAKGLYEDAPPVRPCAYCGGKVKDGIVGRWVTTNKWRRFLLLDNYGYWELRTDVLGCSKDATDAAASEYSDILAMKEPTQKDIMNKDE